jgi:CRISPR/Cas system-associated protein Cas5 (RAMP superfamily)
LPLPPKTTVAGMIGSALGISPDRVNDEWLQNNRFQMGIVGKNNGKANDLWQIRKYDSKQIKAYEKGIEATPYKTAVIVRELLYASEFTLYLYFEKQEDYELILNKIQNPDWALSLGREDELILIQQIKQVDLEEKSDISFSNTVIPADISKSLYNIDLKMENLSINLMNEAPKVVKLPISFSYNENTGAREANEFQTFSFIYNIPVKPKEIKGFYDEGLNHSFQIF